MLNFYYCPACNYPVKLGTFHDLNKTRVCFRCKKKIILVKTKTDFFKLFSDVDDVIVLLVKGGNSNDSTGV